MASNIAAPVWLDKAFLTSTLQENDSSMASDVLTYSVEPAVAAGNNYVCLVYRVIVEFKKSGKLTRTSLFVKTPLQAGEAKDMLDQMGLIDKECTIYKELLPIMDKLVKKKITPKSYDCQVPETIIMEDLKEQGYIMCDRIKQLDFDHCNSVMKALSTFHASSLQINKENPELIAKVGKEVIYSEAFLQNQGKEYFSSGQKMLASVLEEWEGYEHFAKYYRNNAGELYDKIITIHMSKKHLRVLNHGDLWTNNILFKHDDTGKVIDVKLIDLQISRFASPAIDLIMFIVTSAREDVKLHRLPELFCTYLETFSSTLESIGCDERLTWEQLQDELKFAEALPLSLLYGYLPIILSDKANAIDMEKLMEAWRNTEEEGQEPNIIQKNLNSPHFKTVAKYTLNKLEEDGFF